MFLLWSLALAQLIELLMTIDIFSVCVGVSMYIDIAARTLHVCMWHGRFLCNCLQKRTILKSARNEHQNACVSHACMLEV